MFLKSFLYAFTLGVLYSASAMQDFDKSSIVVQIVSTSGKVVVEGQGVTYKIIAENRGSRVCENLALDVLVDETFSFISAECSQGHYNKKTKKWSIERLEPNERAWLYYKADVPCNLNLSKTPEKPYRSVVKIVPEATTNNHPLGAFSENTIYVNSFDPDLKLDNADVLVQITANKGFVAPEDEVAYTISVTNKGPATAREVIVIDEFPEYLSLVRGLPDQGSYSQGIWKLGDVDVCSGTVNLKIAAKVSALVPKNTKISKIIAYVAVGGGIKDNNATKDVLETTITTIARHSDKNKPSDTQPNSDRSAKLNADSAAVLVDNDPVEVSELITANGDGINDELVIKHSANYKLNTLRIFNKYGTLVYQSSKYGHGDRLFDGTTQVSSSEKGTVLQEGVYFYVLEYTSVREKTEQSKKGYFYLKRSVE